ncbi:MAG: ribonucleotide-diphosphate reductase subunit beta [Dehalococcoidia bacterium]|nr:ribonucleotide-diphosphate reductase subunit beta [Dehalococcoidia bacterium]
MPQVALLDPGLSLTLRPMRYPGFYEGYQTAIKNTWTVSEVDFDADLPDLRRMPPAERHMIRRLVAFFATGDSIVSNNVALVLYKHLNAPEVRMYLSRQMYEEAVHIEFYLTLLDTYVPDHSERHAMFRAVDTIPSIKDKADFCAKYMDEVFKLPPLKTPGLRRQFLLNLIAYGCFVEGLFFYGAFAYVYFLREKGLLNALASGTNWVFRDESMHMAFAMKIIETIREEEPKLFDDDFAATVRNMAKDAVVAEGAFAADLLGGGVLGLSLREMSEYLKYVADQRLEFLQVRPLYNVRRNPLDFMKLFNVQELSNFFERRVSAYQVGGDWTPGHVRFDEAF